MNFLFEFSFSHCITICAFLVPANLLLTLWTLLLVGRPHSAIYRYLTTLAASLVALILLLHDFTWFLVGVVMAPTYILLILGGACLSFNVWAIAHPHSMKQVLKGLLTYSHFQIHKLHPSPYSLSPCIGMQVFAHKKYKYAGLHSNQKKF